MKKKNHFYLSFLQFFVFAAWARALSLSLSGVFCHLTLLSKKKQRRRKNKRSRAPKSSSCFHFLHAAAGAFATSPTPPPLLLPLITLFVALASTLGGLLVTKISPSASVSSPSAPAWCADPSPGGT